LAETEAMYCSCGDRIFGFVSLLDVFLLGGVRMRIVMENEGCWVNINLPNSTMDIKCPLPRAGYITMVSFMFESLKKKGYVFCGEFTWSWREETEVYLRTLGLGYSTKIAINISFFFSWSKLKKKVSFSFGVLIICLTTVKKNYVWPFF
jgi:hypothetical protein